MNCPKCGRKLTENAKYCTYCTTRIPSPDNGFGYPDNNSHNNASIFCSHCGKEIPEKAVICLHCGCAVTPDFAEKKITHSNSLVCELSKRVKRNAIVWFCIAAFQLFIGWQYNWVLLIPGVLNVISASMDLNYSSNVLNNPTGIVKKYEPMTAPIITAIYNLTIGGVIGVAGSVYYFVAIRQYVLDNRQAFESLENDI